MMTLLKECRDKIWLIRDVKIKIWFRDPEEEMFGFLMGYL